jgi:hypothetical protein
MVSEKAAYWMAAAVMVFGLAHRGFTAGPDCTSAWLDRFASVSDRISSQADRLLSRTELACERRQPGVDRGRIEVARTQQKFACMQAALARRQGDFARLEQSRGRLVAVQQMRHVMFSPRQDFVVKVPEGNGPGSSILIDGGTL